MANLEERLFQSKVPGRYSEWEKEEKPDKHLHESDDIEAKEKQEKEQDCNDKALCDCEKEENSLEYQQIISEREKKEGNNKLVPEYIRNAIQAGHRPGHKTGPKGVLADHRATKKAEVEFYYREKAKREKDLKDMALGRYNLNNEEIEGDKGYIMDGYYYGTIDSLEQNLNGNKKESQDLTLPDINVTESFTSKYSKEKGGLSRSGVDLDSEDEEEDDFDEDAFLAYYRNMRLNQFKSMEDLPVFGEIKEVSQSEYVDAIDREDSRIIVIVHIYEDQLKVCRQINKQLENLARKYPRTKFLRMKSTETASKLDQKALPCIIAYRGGDVIESFVRIHELLPPDFEFEDIEWLLEEKDMLITPTYDNCQKYKEKQHAEKGKGGENGISSNSTSSKIISSRVAAISGSSYNDLDLDDEDLENI